VKKRGKKKVREGETVLGLKKREVRGKGRQVWDEGGGKKVFSETEAKRGISTRPEKTSQLGGDRMVRRANGAKKKENQKERSKEKRLLEGG